MVSTETNLVNWKMIFYTKKGGEDDLLSLSIVGEPENLVWKESNFEPSFCFSELLACKHVHKDTNLQARISEQVFVQNNTMWEKTWIHPTLGTLLLLDAASAAKLSNSVLSAFQKGPLKLLAVLPIIDGEVFESCWTEWTSPSSAAGRRGSLSWSPTWLGSTQQDSAQRDTLRSEYWVDLKNIHNWIPLLWLRPLRCSEILLDLSNEN